MNRKIKTRDMRVFFLFGLIILFYQAKSQNSTKELILMNRNIIPEELTSTSDEVVFMGNSIFESWSKFDSVFFIQNRFVNKGISGQTSLQMLGRFRQDVINVKPRSVVILAGTNDIAGNMGPVTLESIFYNIQSMTELAKYNGIKVYICSVLPVLKYKWAPQVEPVEKIINLNHLLKDYCTSQNIEYVDFYTKMADSSKGLDKLYTADGVHPNAKGYAVMEEILMNVIQSR
jgi:lysophospholipase L1-like esterase